MPLYADPRPEPISAEPVAWLLSGGGAKNVVVFDGGNAYADPLREVTPLYRHAQPAPVAYSDFEEFWSAYIHPLAQDDELKGFAWDIWSVLGSNSQPAPVVPAEKTMPNPLSMYAVDAVAAIAEVKGWNACRAAMLQSGNSPAQNHGWIPVSERMPEKGQAVLVYRPKAHEGGDSDVRVAVYGRHNFEHGFGCYWEPSHWMPLPAAPQEVKSES
ncbi:DUF551 domain-containing protein [Klebsiella quasipneumoniae]